MSLENTKINAEKAVLVGLVTGRQDEDKVHDYPD